jgi:hypothetical protein
MGTAFARSGRMQGGLRTKRFRANCELLRGRAGCFEFGRSRHDHLADWLSEARRSVPASGSRATGPRVLAASRGRPQ